MPEERVAPDEPDVRWAVSVERVTVLVERVVEPEERVAELVVRVVEAVVEAVVRVADEDVRAALVRATVPLERCAVAVVVREEAAVRVGVVCAADADERCEVEATRCAAVVRLPYVRSTSETVRRLGVLIALAAATLRSAEAIDRREETALVARISRALVIPVLRRENERSGCATA